MFLAVLGLVLMAVGLFRFGFGDSLSLAMAIGGLVTVLLAARWMVRDQVKEILRQTQ